MAALVCAAGRLGAADALKTPEPLAFAQQAVDFLAAGQTTDAARKTRAALQLTPDDALIQILAGALDLQTGDMARAQTAFENALRIDAKDALARYGRGVTLLARGAKFQEQARRDFTLAETLGGEARAIETSRRYAQSFDAAPAVSLTVRSVNSDGDLSDAERALFGFQLARGGAKREAIPLLEKILRDASADFAAPPAGLRMAFRAKKPFAFAARLPAELAPDTEATRAGIVSGDWTLTPRNAAPETIYVSYEIDGREVGLVNVTPFDFTWNSRDVANGWHTLRVRCYDRDGAEMDATESRLRVYNRSREAAREDTTARTLRDLLWKLLTPTPDRAALAAELGALYDEEGNRASAEMWLWEAVARNTSDAETRKRLAALGVRPATDDAFYGGLTTRKEIALTFDDGPKPGLTEPLIDLLVRERVPATFFVIGRNAAANPEITRKIARAGMELANHSYTHRNLTRLSPDEVAEEMARTQATLFALTGQRARSMRPPGGAWNAKVGRIVRQWGLTPCFWTVDAFGAEAISAQQTAQAVVSQARPGAIILMHNGKLSALQALPTILRELRVKGYTFVTAATLAQHFKAGQASERDAARRAIRKSHAE